MSNLVLLVFILHVLIRLLHAERFISICLAINCEKDLATDKYATETKI